MALAYLNLNHLELKIYPKDLQALLTIHNLIIKYYNIIFETINKW